MTSDWSNKGPKASDAALSVLKTTMKSTNQTSSEGISMKNSEVKARVQYDEHELAM